MLELARDGLLYLDTSALMKLVVEEDESAALREELTRWGDGRFDAIIVAAATMGPPTLRSLDAIHLASAVAARVGDHSAVVCDYDRRLQEAAAQAGLMTVSPA